MTWTGLELGVEAVPVAVSWVDETNAVVRNCVPNTTTAPFTKFLPVTDKVKFPIGKAFGAHEVTTGIGLSRVTVLDEAAEVWDALVACTCTEFGVGREAGD